MRFDKEREAQRLLRAIIANPGIKQSGLFRYSQLLSTSERKEAIDLLLSRQQIRPEKRRGNHGPACVCYWPTEAVAGLTGDLSPNPLSVALAASGEAQRALARLDTALQQLAAQEAAKAAPLAEAEPEPEGDEAYSEAAAA
jgi:hypothetical protein